MAANSTLANRTATLSKAQSVLQSAEFARSEANAAKRAMRLATKPQPEVHLIGEICGGTGFGSDVSVSCKWAIECGDQWVMLEGTKGGQTQTDTPDAGTDTVVWNHPIDAHYVVGAMQGWPRLLAQVWRVDDVGRLEVCGYGMVHIPTSPGCHELGMPCWRPVGTPEQEMAAFFVGGVPSLRSTSVLSSAATERYRLVTTSSGTVHVRLDVVLRHLAQFEAEY